MPDNVRFTRANAIGIRFDAASNNSSHINASPAEDVAVKVLAPAASDPIAALIAECSLSTGTNSVSISPFAIYVETICGISVDEGDWDDDEEIELETGKKIIGRN